MLNLTTPLPKGRQKRKLLIHADPQRRTLYLRALRLGAAAAAAAADSGGGGDLFIFSVV